MRAVCTYTVQRTSVRCSCTRIRMGTQAAVLRELPATVRVGPSLAASLRIQTVVAAVEEAAKDAGRVTPPRLVAVSKNQSVEKVQWAYQEGLRHFGENYVQEIHKKSNHLQRLAGIRWHFIGHLQRNKTKLLMDCPSLWMVETVNKWKTAHVLDRHWGLGEREEPLRVLVQVNTSGEASKHGCHPDECLELAQRIHEDCKHLRLCGLMTIGRPRHHHPGQNPDFQALLQCSVEVQKALGGTQPLELSMGMSTDFQHAIQMGSTNLRIGTALFGPRD